MKKDHKLMLLTVLACAAISSSFAATKAPNVDASKTALTPAATAAAGAVSLVATAHALVRYGDANKDPMALITAAKILNEVGKKESNAKRTAGTPGTKTGVDRYSPAAILERAKVLATGRADLLALADDVSTNRGRDRGPGQTDTVVSALATDTFRMVFTGGELARVVVSGDGDSDLDLYITDENGADICKDLGPTDDMVCTFRPRWTGPFTVRVKNLGMANRYQMYVN